MHARHARLRLAALAAILALLMALVVPARAATTFEDSHFAETTVVDNKNLLGENQPVEGQPNGMTCMAWAPGTNRLYVTTKGRNDGDASIYVLNNGVLQTTPFYTFPIGSMESNNECGLESICFHPDYASGTKQIFCFVTVSPTESRIVRFTENFDGTNYLATGAPTPIVSGIPSSANVHNGGGLTIAPDQNGNGRFIYWAAGNHGEANANGGEKLETSSLGSKVGRANLDGSIPSDGLNVTGYIWSFGYRNPFTMTTQPATGRIWVNTVGGEYEQSFMPTPGSWAGDEFYTNGKDPENQALRDKQIVPMVKYKTGGADTRTLTSAVRAGGVVTYTTTARHGFRRGEKITVAGVSNGTFNGAVYVLSTPSDTVFTAEQAGTDGSGTGGTVQTQLYGNAITGGAFYDKTAWPEEFHGNFFFADYSGRIVRVQFNADNTVKKVDLFMNTGNGTTDITFGPDGNMYYTLIGAGIVRKVVYTSLVITSNPTLPATTNGRPYSQSLTVTGGTAPYTWTVSAGALPAGLTLNPNSGVISGTPTANGTFNFTVTAADANSSGQKAFTLVVNAAPAITTATLPSGNLGITYNQTLASTGGTAPRVWSISVGTLPPGITLNPSSGNLNGMPTADGTSNFTVALTDAAGAVATRALSIVITSGNQPPSFITTPVTAGNIGTPYTYDVDANGYPAPTYSLTSAPGSMSINATTGVIAWTPGLLGDYSVVVKAANGVNPDATQSFTITVTNYGLGARPVATANLGLNPAALPGTLSATGVFTDLVNLVPSSSLIPFNVNTPLWSDGSHKKRWIAVPTGEKIGFAATGEWTFPAGTVLVKHFELSLSEPNPEILKRLETRLLFVNADASVYGVTYRWRADGSDADLLPNGADETITIATSGGSRQQTWHYPSASECLQCHTNGAGGVLGVKTRQLNGNYAYPSTGVTDNQLRAWNHVDLFTTPLNEATIPTYQKLAPLGDTTASLEHRVRSYIDSNCAHCHRPGGTPAQFDARFDIALANQNIVNGSVGDALGIAGAKVVVPHDVLKSIMHKRMDTNDPLIRMPRLARSEIDTQAVAVLRDWIDSLPNGTGLTGEYYDNDNLTNLVLTRNDATVNFDWGAGAPLGSMGVDSYSIRWSGQVQAPYSETYTFYTVSDDGARLWVNGQQIINKWQGQGTTEWTGTIALTAGQKVSIVLEYLEQGGGANVKLMWSSATTAKEVVPQAYLYPTSSNAAPTVAITAPAANATFTAPATVNITATAADSDGTVTKVEFYQGGVKIGEDLSATGGWTFVWDGVAAGAYSLTAVATDNGTATATSAIVPITVSGGQGGTGTGLTGNYFDALEFATPILTRTDATVDFDWGGGSPDAAIGADTYSIRWTGEVKAEYTETYTFYTVTDDGVRLWVNGVQLVNEWHGMGATEFSGTVAMVAGQKYAIVMEYFEDGGGASAKLLWQSASTTKAIIPQAQLYPSVTNAAPTVAITAPAANATFTAPATVNITANAVDSDGTVTKVEFFQGTTKIGEDLSATGGWTLAWTGVAAGNYSLTAKATDNGNATTTSAAIAITVNPASGGDGTGLTGEYYDNNDFTGAMITRVDPTVNFDWVAGAPFGSMGVDDFSVRWTGEVKAQYTETYTFYTQSDDGVKLWVNNQLLIDQWHGQGNTEWNGTIALTAGQKYAIKLEFLEQGGDAIVKLLWSSDSTTKAIIPQAQLYPAGVANVPPTVSITAPAANATFTAPATVNITATAADSDGTVSKVEFFQNGNKIGEDTTAGDGWTLVWNGVAAGSYSLTAVATDNSNATTTSTAVAITVNAASGGDGTGLTGEYYDNNDFTGALITRVDPTVNFNWGAGSPDASMAVNDFSVRWTGEVKAQYTETYTFYTSSDDGVKLWVNNVLLIDQWHGQGTTEYNGTIALTAGTKYAIKLEYLELGGDANVKLSWQSASTTKAVIPQVQLYPSGSTPPPAPAAPTNLTATAASSTSINLAWTDASNNESGFEIERSPNGTTWSALVTTAANATTHADTGLTAATAYYYRIRAVNTGGNSAYAGPAMATTNSGGGGSLPSGGLKINFQPANATVPSGYLADGGAVFADRGNGYSYGWNADNSATSRDRNSPTSPDQRYDTLQHMQKAENPNAVWEVALPNGSYTIHVVAGDPSNFDSTYKMNAEGTLAVNGQPISTQRWIEGTVTVTVADGRLTITNAAGANNNKICFVEITEAGSGGPPPAPEARGANENGTTFEPATATQIDIVIAPNGRAQSAKLTAVLPATVEGGLAGMNVGVDLGGAVMEFVLDKNGRGSVRGGRCVAKANAAAGTVTVSVTMKGSWVEAWNDSGLVAAKAATIELPFAVLVGETAFGGSSPLTFNGKSGKVRAKK